MFLLKANLEPIHVIQFSQASVGGEVAREKGRKWDPSLHQIMKGIVFCATNSGFILQVSHF